MDGTLITVGNAGEEPVDALITLYSAAGVELYEMEAALPPQEQAWVDVGRLIRQQVPDKEGRVLPADITSGSYAFRERERKAIGSLYEGKVVIDKTYGSVTYGCGYGCCIQLAYLIPSPYVFPAGWGFVGVEGQSGCGSTDLTSWTWDWMTGHTNIALAHGFGSMEGLSPGSTWTGAWVYTEVEDWVSGTCYPVATYVDGPVEVTQPHPVNFRKTGAQDMGNGTLRVTYQWDSSTGHLPDLSSCVIGEYVAYPTPPGVDYQPPSPPWPLGVYQNPTIPDPGPATAGGFHDDHSLESTNFVHPYSSHTWTATQYYWYRCGTSPDEILMQNLIITRSISPNGADGWKFTASKTGTETTAIIDPLP